MAAAQQINENNNYIFGVDQGAAVHGYEIYVLRMLADPAVAPWLLINKTQHLAVKEDDGGRSEWAQAASEKRGRRQGDARPDQRAYSPSAAGKAV